MIALLAAISLRTSNIVDGIVIFTFAGSIAISFVVYTKSKITKATIETLQSLVSAYGERVKQLEDQKTEDQRQHLENVRAIADLTGQVKVYKELPLQKMATAMEVIAETSKTTAVTSETNAKTNERILAILTTSAATLAVDTKDAASAVKEVKADLKGHPAT